MRIETRGVVLLCAVAATVLVSPDDRVDHAGSALSASHAVPALARERLTALGSIAMAFEPNRGQAGADAAFVARGRGYAVEIGDRRARLRLKTSEGDAPARLEMEVLGASRHARAVGTDPQPGRSHYLLGSDPARHVRDVPHLSRVNVRSIYPDIDLLYYGKQSDLEYDFIVKPGADPGRIQVRFQGQDSLHLSPEGDLIFRFGQRELRHPRPVVYTFPDRAPVEGGFVVGENGTVGFDVGDWDRTRTLVIDPTLVFGTYLGGSGNDSARGVAVDPSGNIYVGGTTASTTGFPLQGALQGTFGGGTTDAFVTKFNPTGTAIVYSTFVGSTGADEGRGLAVDGLGQAYLTGSTTGSIPGSSTVCNSSDGFVIKLNAAGNAFVYSRCIGTGGTEWGNAIAVDGAGNAYVTGLWNGGDAFMGKLDAAGTTFTNTVLAGSSNEEGLGIAADAAGNVCVTGQTWSTNFPVVNARQPALSGGSPYDAFVAKYNSSGGVVFVTYLGGSSLDTGYGAAIDGSGNCYVTGSTLSTNFPTLNASQGASGGGQDAFVTAYDATGSNVLYSTYLGGSSGETGFAIAASASGIVHLVGQSGSANFPVQDPSQPELKDLAWCSARRTRPHRSRAQRCRVCR